jgi:hypothetical protein
MKTKKKHRNNLRRKRTQNKRDMIKINRKLNSRRTRINRRGGEKISFTKTQCAPKNDNEVQDFSCYTKKSLIKMRNLWNTRHKDSLIEVNESKEIWDALRLKMENACHSESCWLKQKFMENNLDEEMTKYTFAPNSPSTWKENHTTWLNSGDIEKVMKQYEHTYKCFRFIGPTPIDFDKHVLNNKCVWDDLCNFELSKFIDEGITKIGIIFNTDPHDKSGSHWISLFINIKKKFVFFFDSNGTKIPKEIKSFCNRVISQGLKLNTTKYPDGLELKFYENAPFIHQEKNTECGMYSLYFIVTLLKDAHDYTFFKKKKISDEAMEDMRDKYFNN